MFKRALNPAVYRQNVSKIKAQRYKSTQIKVILTLFCLTFFLQNSNKLTPSTQGISVY